MEHIREADPSIQAWVQVLPQISNRSGALSDIPVGVKDIIETRGLRIEYGSPIHKGRISTADASIVLELRRRGATILGKTHTAAFAYRDPAPTRNPWNLQHTPGGSSSGSAAAVAAGMVPLAIGTQTSGSVLRPASYCGVTGFKPTYDLLPFDGILPFAKSLDTLGFFTRTPDDMLLLWEALGHPVGQDEESPIGVPEPMPKVDAEMTAAFQDAVSAFAKAGVPVRPIPISGMLAELGDAQLTVASYEGARFHHRHIENGDGLAQLAALVRDGLQISEGQYEEAGRVISVCKVRIKNIYSVTPVILVPAATGAAPAGLSHTGDARMNAPWTALGTPAISVPMPVGDRLPLGLQLTAAPGEDARVLRAAVLLNRILNQT